MGLCNYKKKLEIKDQLVDSMKNLIDLEKKINSELGTKINTSETKHNQIYLEIDSEDLIDVVLFVKTNKYHVRSFIW